MANNPAEQARIDANNNRKPQPRQWFKRQRVYGSLQRSGREELGKEVMP